MKTRVLAAACALVLVGTGAAGADPGPQPPEVVPKTAAGSSDEIDPGRYRFTLPADETTRYLRISRTKGESVAVAGYAVPRLGVEDDSLDLALVLPDGDTECSSDSDSLTGSSDGEPLLPAVALDGTKSARDDSSTTTASCRNATDLILQISRGSDSDPDDDAEPLPVELTYSKEPARSGAADRPARGGDLESEPVPLKNDENVEPGRTPATAAPLDDDTGTRVRITPGTAAFYKVRVGWNQRLDVAAQIPSNGSRYRAASDLSFALNILGPNGVGLRAGGSNSGSLYRGSDPDPQQLTAYTAPVRWANRNLASTGGSSADSTAVQSTTQPGWYVVYLRAGPGFDDDLPENPEPVPAVLTVRTSGKATAGPSFTAAGKPVAAPAAGQLSGRGDSASGPGGTAVKLGVSVLAVLAAATALLWARRGSRA